MSDTVKFEISNTEIRNNYRNEKWRISAFHCLGIFVIRACFEFGYSKFELSLLERPAPHSDRVRLNFITALTALSIVIDIENITKHYIMGEETVHALRGVTLQIHRNEYLAIMGPSGSGKSTLMNMLGCLDTPSSGRYEFRASRRPPRLASYSQWPALGLGQSHSKPGWAEQMPK